MKRPKSDLRMEVDDSGGSASVYVYGGIGDWWDGVTASELVREIDALDADAIHVYINSPGGIAFDGIAIGNALRRNSAKVTAHIDGLCASAATVIAMAADEVIAYRGSEVMIHDASGLCWGPADDMRATADVLDQLSGEIAALYAERAGGEVDDWRSRMRSETWYTADEAVEAGLADRVDRSHDATNSVARHDLTIYAHAGRANAPAPRREIRAARPAEPDRNQPQGKGVAMATLADGLRDRLGITETDIDDDGLLAALDEALTEQADPTAAAPEGTVLIDREALAELQASASMGREAREAQVTADREALVAAAVSEGRIPPARRDYWNQLLAADPGAAETLNALPKGSVPLASTGYTGGVDEATDDDRLYNRLYSKEA